MKVLATIPEKGYAPSLKHVEEAYKNLSLFNLTMGVCWEVKRVLDQTPVTELQMVKFFDHSDELFPCVEIDVKIYPCVVKNHNGYILQWFSDEKPSEMTIEDYLTWKKLHVAKWINEQWVYIPVAECEPATVLENQEVTVA
jgi:hypothetical protein